MTKIRLVSSLILVLLSVACGKYQPAMTSITTLEQIAATRPTSGIVFTSTPIASPSVTTFPINPTATPVPQSTLSAICTVLPGGKGMTSPDGNWIAVPCLDTLSSLYEDYAYIRIQRLDGTQGWEVSTKYLTSHPNAKIPRGNGENQSALGFLDIVGWDQYSRYVFLSKLYAVDRSPYHTLDGYGLYRLDTQTGQLSSWLGETGISYSFAFSLDGTYLAYSTSMDDNLLHVDNIETGKTETLPIPGKFLWAANFHWSPNSQKMVFMTLHEGWWGNHQSDISMLLFDTRDNQITVLIPHDKQLLDPVEWITDSELLVQDYWNKQSFTFDLPPDQAETPIR